MSGLHTSIIDYYIIIFKITYIILFSVQLMRLVFIVRGITRVVDSEIFNHFRWTRVFLVPRSDGRTRITLHLDPTH